MNFEDFWKGYISAGIPIPTVSKRAGHANPGITTMLYSHAIKSLAERAAEALDEIVMRNV